MEKLKKLSLKKEVIANISDNQMNHLWGGYDTIQPTDGVCTPNTCNGGPACLATKGELTCETCLCPECVGCPMRLTCWDATCTRG